MPSRAPVYTGDKDEAELLGHMCSLVARDRDYAMASIAAVEPDGSLRMICRSGEAHALRDDAVQAVIPFTVGGAPMVFLAESATAQAFSSRELDVLEELCAVFTQTLMNIRTREAELRSQRDRATDAEERISALWTIANRTLGTNYDAGVIARDILLEGRVRLGLQWGYIGRIDGERVVVDMISDALRGGSSVSPHPLENTSIPLEQTLSGETYNAQVTRSYMRAGHRMTLTSPKGREETLEIQSFLGTPFRAGGQWYLLCFGSSQPRDDDFSEQDERYIELLASIFTRTLEQRATLEQIEYLQDHDALTRLPHRNRFHVRLSELLQKAERSEPIAVLIVDTDKFRQLLDEHGPEAGDEIVLELAQRIRLTKSEQHELFRYRSDSFAMIVHGARALTEVHFLAERCIAAIGMPMKINGEDARLTASIGIAIYPSDGEDVAALSIAATTAMRRAKRAGPAQFRFYNELLDERFGRRRLFAEELREAVDKNELALYYQPIVDLQTHAVIGAEALLRWHHPRRGIVGAAEFIHVAEETDLINEIGSWVLSHAARQAREWSDLGIPIVVAINLSARQFRDPGLLADVEIALKASGTPARLLEFEVTESIAMHDPDAAAYTLGCFRDLGLRIALDDFGTGHSSLAYLKRFPIDIIKLDQAFVAGLPSETADAAIANAVVALASSMGCEVRAEGIEMPAQELFLRGIGVHSAQGFLIAPPLLPRAFERWLASSKKIAAYRA
jgi:diguanylate cyclase (GGDEF)-like protein